MSVSLFATGSGHAAVEASNVGEWLRSMKGDDMGDLTGSGEVGES